MLYAIVIAKDLYVKFNILTRNDGDINPKKNIILVDFTSLEVMKFINTEMVPKNIRHV
jgi:hypothetical protein